MPETQVRDERSGARNDAVSELRQIHAELVAVRGEVRSMRAEATTAGTRPQTSSREVAKGVFFGGFLLLIVVVVVTVLLDGVAMSLRG
jgi:hypothetical protein